jgi:glycosyltransferase involved in cell wall biosynthesis
MLGMSKNVSIVIIGRNEGPRLVRCLESVRAMLGKNSTAEIVYVDSGSNDGSVQCALHFGASVVTLLGRCSAARARNAGWRASSGDWILFLDGDTIVHPAFLSTALEHAADPRVAAVWGHRRELHPHSNFYHRVLDLDWVYAPGPSEFCGGDALMRRIALEQAGGFDDSLIAGEEPELCARLRGQGYEILHIDAPMTGHDLAITRFSQYWKRAVRAGYAYAQLEVRTRNYAQPMWRGETRRNAIRASVLAASLLLLPMSAFLLHNWVPLAVTIFLCLALIIRSAFRARWKSPDLVTLLCYGMHSHFQQFPILAGQLACRRDMALAHHRDLIEYK